MCAWASTAMDLFPPLLAPLEDDRPAPPPLKLQGDFVSYLVNAYYIEPSKRLAESEKSVVESDCFSHLAYRDSFFSTDVAKVIGRIAEETFLLEQHHVQDKPPFRIVERPLLVSGMIGCLLRRMMLHESGVFISSTTLDKWLSVALGTKISLARYWLDADYRIQRLLRTSQAKRLVEERGAGDTDIRAIRQQTKRGGMLHGLWSDTYQMLREQFGGETYTAEVAETLFTSAAKASVVLRQKVDAMLHSRAAPIEDDAMVLYAAAEPEICSGVTFHCFFREVEALFNKQVRSREQRVTSAAIMRNCFMGSLNAFTANQYDAKKAACVFPTLDALAWIADGKCMVTSLDLRNDRVTEQTTYIQHAALLGCDHVDDDIQETREKAGGFLLLHERRQFSQMDPSAMTGRALYPYQLAEPPKDDKRGVLRGAEITLPTSTDSEEDWQDYSVFVVLTLSEVEDDLATYMLPEDQRVLKRRIVVEMRSTKRSRKE